MILTEYIFRTRGGVSVTQASELVNGNYLDYLTVTWNLLLVFFLVLLNGFFVAAEFAMVKVRETRIETLVLSGETQAKSAYKVVQHLDAYLSACQLGITLASLGLGWIGEPAVAKILSHIFLNLGWSVEVTKTMSFAVAFSFITAMHIILGELAPKTIAIQHSERVALWTAWPLITFNRIMYPFIWILNHAANFLLKRIGVEPTHNHDLAHSEEELRIIMEESHKSGYIDNTELMFVDNIFNFSERTAREIMIPRTDMVCLYKDNTFEENLDIALQEELTRYPVCNPDKDSIIGFVHIKDMLTIVAKDKPKVIDNIVRKIITAPETISVSELLKTMQKNHMQIALLIDEYGGTAGMITLEDILEEIVGEIQDEFDEERPEIEKLGDGSYSIAGMALVEDVNELLDIKLDEDSADTIGGWLYMTLGEEPELGKSVKSHGYEFTVSEVENLRVNRIRVEKYEEDEAEDSSDQPMLID